jgi:PKD repeat protein
MKNVTLILTLMLVAVFGLNAQQYTYEDAWGNAGFNLVASESSTIEVIYSVPVFALEDQEVNGEAMKNIMLPGNFLFNDAGAPNLPATGRYVAIPQGSVPSIRIINQRTEVIHNVDILPAPEIPLETDDSPLQHTKNMDVYGKDAFYPANPVIISEITQIRGTDAVILSVTPFQYNPVTKDLIVYRDLQIAIDCEGGSGTYGNERLRSPYWDGIMANTLLNYNALPEVDYATRMNEYLQSYTEDDDCEYIIITPTGPDYLAWADSIAKFRNEQGILTKVFTVDEIGGNTTSAIEGFINNAYNTWDPAPVACLLLGDYGSNAASNIIAPIYNNYCASDNMYADVNNDMMPDVIFARMTANNNTQLTTFITKMFDYERNPYTDFDFYNHPITALGWQTERWFQLCSEIVGGFFKHVKGRDPVRINAIYSGSPGSIWSTATNTNTIVNYFGPNGLGYIPATPAELGGWSGGNATMVTNAINDGAFMLQHRDHGGETLWGEPSYNNNNINQLTNDKLPHIFSINCLTGKYNWGGECFAEKFHRHTKNGANAGSLSITAASETSYSFVNDTYVWGMIDNMWPDFMPEETSEVTERGIYPAFGNAGGKYFLKQSNWPYNANNKPVTYNLFHHHGGAFSILYDTIPENLEVDHENTINYGVTTFDVAATDSSIIALSVEGVLVATEYAEGISNPVTFTIPVYDPGTMIKVVVTKQNYFRYESMVEVTTELLIANFSASPTNLCTGGSTDFSDLSSGTPTGWSWTFDGGTPATSTEQNPTGIVYDAAGTYSVTLEVTKDGETSTETKTDYIAVYNTPMASWEAANLCEDVEAEFTDMTDPNGGTITSWLWNFGDPGSGVFDTSSMQNPTHIYTTPGTYHVSMEVTNNGTCVDMYEQDIIIAAKPGQAAQPQGDATICQGSVGNLFTTAGTPEATSYTWTIDPADAGTLMGTDMEASLDISETFTGSATLRVKGVNDCGEGQVSDALTLTIMGVLPAPAQSPAGPDTVDLKTATTSDYTTDAITGAVGYSWKLMPEAAGTITPSTGTGETATVTWDAGFIGDAEVSVAGIDDECTGLYSPVKMVHVKNTTGIHEFNAYQINIYPNPNSGKFTLELQGADQGDLTVTVFNVLGSVVYQEQVSVFNKLHKTLDLSSLPGGVYHLRVNGSQGSAIQRIILEK